MKKYILLSFTLGLLIIAGSCKKETPPTGIYIGTFSYDYPNNWSDKTIWYKISDANKDYFLIGTSDYQGNLSPGYQDTIYRDKKEVKGKVPSNSGTGPYKINGDLSHKLFSKDYTIEGDFTQTQSTQGGVFTYSGTFVIKSN